LIKREAIKVVSKDPSMISTMDKCDIEDMYTTHNAHNVTEGHET